MIKNFFIKLFNKKRYDQLKNEHKIVQRKAFYNQNIKKKIDEISSNIKNKSELNFLHSGHLGDIIYSLPIIKELAKTKKCNLFVEINKKNKLPYLITRLAMF